MILDKNLIVDVNEDENDINFDNKNNINDEKFEDNNNNIFDENDNNLNELFKLLNDNNGIDKEISEILYLKKYKNINYH